MEFGFTVACIDGDKRLRWNSEEKSIPPASYANAVSEEITRHDSLVVVE